MVVTEQSGGVRANTLRQENAELREQNRLLQAEVIVLRQQANYHRSQHKRAVQRAQELEVRAPARKGTDSTCLKVDCIW